MQTLESLDGGDSETVFRDLILLALMGFVALVLLVLPHINPPTTGAAAIEPPGNVMVEVRWPDTVDADVDLWVEAPGDVPVGYSNKGGQVFNLLRDDLGHSADPTGLNYEMAFSRGAPAGAYTVNLHLYRGKPGILPVEAVVVVSVKRPEGRSVAPIATETVRLSRVGQEITALRFSLNADGDLVAGSLHQLPRPLRSAKASGRESADNQGANNG